MKKFLYLVLLIFPLPVISQHFIGKTRAEIIKELEKKTARSTDSTIIYSANEEGMKAEFIYSFDKNGKCLLEMLKAADEGSYQYYLKATLAITEFEWKKINENQYVSKFNSYLMLELPGEALPHQFNVFRTEWSKEMYEMVTGTKVN